MTCIQELTIVGCSDGIGFMALGQYKGSEGSV